MNPYRLRVLELLRAQLAAPGPVDTALDFGCGDGWFARQMLDSGTVRSLEAIDVKRRPQCHVDPTIYPGGPLPYADRQFQLVYAVDVLHHCADPAAQLLELARCAERFILLKDHTYSSAAGKWTLAILDELGNRRFGIPSPYLYQKDWEWHTLLTGLGWERVGHVHPAPVHVSLLGWLTNPLQYVSLYRRSGGASAVAG